MTWTQTTDAAELWRQAGAWLGEHPVENAPLLAEVAHLLATDAAPQGLECGWWSDDSGGVGAAYVQAPRHDPLLTRMPRAALDELVLLGARPAPWACRAWSPTTSCRPGRRPARG